MAGNNTDKLYNAYSRISGDEIPQAPYPYPLIAYYASKVALQVWAEDFAKMEIAKFDPVHILSTWVIGANPTFTRPEELLKSTSFKLMSVVLDLKVAEPSADAICSVDDTARIFCESLAQRKLPANTSILIAHQGFKYNDAIAIAKKSFAEAVTKGTLPLGEERATLRAGLDVLETEKLFGSPEIYEDSVKSSISQYLDLVEGYGVPKVVTSGEYRNTSNRR